MTSHTTRRFRDALHALPQHIRWQASQAYRLFGQNPRHPSLRFKQIHPTRPIFPVRISADYRALGVRDADEIVWFWIGSHADYEQLSSRL